MSEITPKQESPQSLAITRRAEEIRETPGMTWERACLLAEREVFGGEDAPEGWE